MPELWSGDFRDLLFLVLRVIAAAGGFMVGWYLTGPAVRIVTRVVFRRSLPRWAVYWWKLAGGLLIAVLVFWLLPLGSGGGGGGSGGGKGKGIGPGTDGTGDNAAQTGKGEGDVAGKASASPLPKKATERLVVQLLGGDAVKDSKCYLIGQQPTPVDGPALKKYLQENLQKIAEVEMVLTDNSVAGSHPWSRYLQQLVLDELGLPLKVVDRSKKT